MQKYQTNALEIYWPTS